MAAASTLLQSRHSDMHTGEALQPTMVAPSSAPDPAAHPSWLAAEVPRTWSIAPQCTALQGLRSAAGDLVFVLRVGTGTLAADCSACRLSVAVHDMANVLHFPPAMHPSFRMPKQGSPGACAGGSDMRCAVEVLLQVVLPPTVLVSAHNFEASRCLGVQGLRRTPHPCLRPACSGECWQQRHSHQ